MTMLEGGTPAGVLSSSTLTLIQPSTSTLASKKLLAVVPKLEVEELVLLEDDEDDDEVDEEDDDDADDEELEFRSSLSALKKALVKLDFSENLIN
jgi:hypothetical protein